jgi:hypothetical protein
MFPLIEGDEYVALVLDIGCQGILNPITLFEGRILDGKNRYNAAKDAGHKFTARDFVELAPGTNPRDFVISANAQRRQMNADQKQQFIWKLIRDLPKESNRYIAKLAACDEKTVRNARAKLEDPSNELVERWNGLETVDRSKFVTEFREELRPLL